jgi:hypothetical protein
MNLKERLALSEIIILSMQLADEKDLFRIIALDKRIRQKKQNLKKMMGDERYHNLIVASKKNEMI